MKISMLKFKNIKYKSISIFIVLSTLLSICNISNISMAIINSPDTIPFLEDKFLILDIKKNYKLPPRFRSIQELNISGCAQFRPSQIDNIKVAINSPKITVVDLRQESHGFIDDSPISYYSFFQLINSNLNAQETLKAEKEDLLKIAIGYNIPIFKTTGEYLESLKANTVSNEESTCKNFGLGYKRISVRDNSIPKPESVDDFINFVNTTSDDVHILFHCDAGDGRTTMFMSMFQMMKNPTNASLSTILNDQIAIGGIVLTENIPRATFLEYFYNYTLENKEYGFKTNYSTWLKNKKGLYSESAPLPDENEPINEKS
ncbi:phosphatase [Clostridium sp. DSM 100503]|uniref:phosphatase domain-containing putative toxin n=1 Tax=Clostridium sp. DSM 100503 TaxID=2963282 RepID=UPI00214A39D2|nr:phosphatase [Clostridium sp. DSM 100503]MCR1951803.1 phosphatase [Clostridium sp. DSM 100503]